jgi:hypothetical protein
MIVVADWSVDHGHYLCGMSPDVNLSQLMIIIIGVVFIFWRGFAFFLLVCWFFVWFLLFFVCFFFALFLFMFCCFFITFCFVICRSSTNDYITSCLWFTSRQFYLFSVVHIIMVLLDVYDYFPGSRVVNDLLLYAIAIVLVRRL